MGNSKYASTSAIKTFNVEGAYQTKIVLNSIKDVNLGENAIISGYYYYDQNRPLRQTTMSILLNGVKYYAKTNDNGYFTYNIKTTKTGTNTLTVTYPGNTRFKEAITTTTFNVNNKGPQSTYITLNSIKEVNIGEITQINGYYYYDQGKPLRLTTMTLNINGAKYYAKTDNNGYFTYNYKTIKAGTNTITVSYPGNTNFKAANTTKTFNVETTGPQPTYITLNNIVEVNQGNTVNISGYYYYDQAKPLRLTTMTLNINGAKYYAKTDNNGYFTYNYKTIKAGTNTITVSYPGNTNFKAANTTKTFNVKSTGPQPTFIKLNNINDVAYKDYVIISGHYYYGNNIPLKYTGMKININGEIVYAKTDDTGYFYYNYETEKIGKNTATISYSGNNKFLGASNTKTFNVKIIKPIDTYITTYVDDVKVGEYTCIGGFYGYGNGNPLVQTTMTLNINGQKYYAKTDSDGYYSYNYKTSKIGKNTVTVSYPGNSNFKSASTTETFTVANANGEKIVTIDAFYTNEAGIDTYIGDDYIRCTFETEYNRQCDPGVWVEIRNRYAEALDDLAPTNRIISVKFYFVNYNNGQVKTKTVSSDYLDYASTSIISGCYPTKAEVTYRKMTTQETNEWYNQFY